MDGETLMLALNGLAATELDGLDCKLLYSNTIEKTVVAKLEEGQVMCKGFEGGCEGFVLKGKVLCEVLKGKFWD